MANEVRITVRSEDRSGPGFQSARKRADALGNSTRRIGEIAAGVLASGVFQRISDAASRAFTDSIRAASNLEQAVGGTEAVFGEAGDVIDEFARKSADAVGLSEREFRDATTLIGGQLKRMTGDVDFAADQSIRLTEVAADLAATYGGTTRQAVEALGSAFRGEADPAERFNLNLKIGEVNAKAVEMGLAATTGEVNENARAQATLALIMEQSADAQGQFAREADTAAGAGQRFGATVEDTQAALGQALLPAVSTAAEVLTELLEVFQSMPGPVQTAVAVLGGLLAAVAALGPAVLSAQLAIQAMGVSAGTMARRVGPAIGVIAALTTALAILGGSGRDAKTGVGEATEAILQMSRGAEDTKFDAFVAEIDKFMGEIVFFRDTLKEFEAEFEVFDQALAGLVAEGNGDLAAEQFENMRQKLLDVGVTEKEIEQAFDDYRDALAQVRADTELTTGAIEDAEGGMLDLEEALSRAEQASKDADDALANLKDTLFGTAREALNLEEREDALTEAVKRAKEVSEDDEASKLDQRAAMRAVADQGLSLIETLIDQNASTEDVRDATERARQKFIDVARDMGATKGEARALADQYGLIPDDVATQVDILNYQRTQARIASLAAQWAQIQDKDVTVTVNTIGGYNPGAVAFGTAHGGIIGAERGMQTGGASGARSRVLVGELGPEVVTLPTGSMVTPSVDQATDRNQLAPSAPATATFTEQDLDRLADTLTGSLVRALPRALSGITVAIDDDRRAHLIARRADLIGRAG